MAEEIINALTQLSGLKVAARTSSFSFKGKNEDLRVIGVGVGTVLEGSARRAGSRIRVTAQLIEAASGMHLFHDAVQRVHGRFTIRHQTRSRGRRLPTHLRGRESWKTRNLAFASS
jgi:TolB-like protein